MRLKKSDIRKKEKVETVTPAIAEVDQKDYTDLFDKQLNAFEKLKETIKTACSKIPERKKYAAYNFVIKRNSKGLIENITATPQ